MVNQLFASKCKNMPRSKRTLNKRMLGSEQSQASSNTHNKDQNEVPDESVHNEQQVNESVKETSSGNYENSIQDQSSSTRKKGRTAWEVEVINEEGVVKKKKMKTIDVWSLSSGEGVMVLFDSMQAPTLDTAGLLSGVLSELARQASSFPINYDDWRKVPSQYKNDIFSKSIMPKFHFENVEIAKRWILNNIGRKWSNHKSALWVEFYDPSLTREQLISNCPVGIHRDQWSSFVVNRLSEKSKEMCRRNAESRKCQKIPRTNGSKNFARRRAELENELGRKVNRSELWLDTHKRQDGTYVNDEAKNKSDEIIQEMSRSSYSSQSRFALPDDPLGRVFGKEHAGRVRGASFGPCPTIAFGCRFGSSSNDGQMREYVASMEKELAATKSILRAQSLQLQAQNVQMEEMKKNLGGALVTIFENALGKVPEQFASWLTQTSKIGPSDERSTHPPSSENERRDSSSSRDVI